MALFKKVIRKIHFFFVACGRTPNHEITCCYVEMHEKSPVLAYYMRFFCVFFETMNRIHFVGPKYAHKSIPVWVRAIRARFDDVWQLSSWVHI